MVEAPKPGTEASFRLLVDAVSDYAIFLLDPAGVVMTWNTGAQRMKGYRAEEIIGKHFSCFYLQEDRDLGRPDEVLRHAAAAGHHEEEGWRVRKDGTQFFADVVVTAVYDDGRLAGFGKVTRDVTARKERELEQADRLTMEEATARTDALTGLPNRRAWDEELRREIARATRHGDDLAVAMLDLDHFKQFNDDRGHQAGDSLLQEAAQAWRLQLRVDDFIARYGGEEFALALPRCPLDEATLVVERIRAATPKGQTSSAGIVMWRGDESAEAVVGRADTALYQAKRAGRDRATIA